MEIINDNLLHQSELEKINEIEKFSLLIEGSLVFDIAKIVRPIGTTQVVIKKRKDPERKELIKLQVPPLKIEGIKRKQEIYHDNMKEAEGIYYQELERCRKQYGIGNIPEYEDNHLNQLEQNIAHWSELEQGVVGLLNRIISNNGTPYSKTWSTLGEYIQNNDSIVLYYDTIEQYGHRDATLIYTLVHELFHAFYYKSSACVTHPVIKEIDEAMVEFSMLTYIGGYKHINNQWGKIFDIALNDVKLKQQSLGLSSSYGFGAFIFEHCATPNSWMARYYSKFGRVNNHNKNVLSYIEGLNPLYTNNELKTFNILKNILFDDYVKIYLNNGKVGLIEVKTNSRVVMSDGMDTFDDIVLVSIMDPNSILNYAAVKKDDKCNLAYMLDDGNGLAGASQLHYVFKNWVDNLKLANDLLFIEMDGKDVLLWRDGYRLGESEVKSIYRAANGVYVLENYEGKFNFFKPNDDGLFSRYKWFDGCYDFGDDDLSDGSDDAIYPIVVYKDKSTYIDTESFRFVFQRGREIGQGWNKIPRFEYDNDDFDSVTWFDDCYPYEETNGEEQYIFPVVVDGEEKYLSRHGEEVDENGNYIEP